MLSICYVCVICICFVTGLQRRLEQAQGNPSQSAWRRNSQGVKFSIEPEVWDAVFLGCDTPHEHRCPSPRTVIYSCRAQMQPSSQGLQQHKHQAQTSLLSSDPAASRNPRLEECLSLRCSHPALAKGKRCNAVQGINHARSNDHEDES